MDLKKKKERVFFTVRIRPDQRRWLLAVAMAEDRTIQGVIERAIDAAKVAYEADTDGDIQAQVLAHDQEPSHAIAE